MTARDWRAGELRFLLVALIVAVAAMSAVGFFIDRMRAGLERDAHQMLGADLLISSDTPIRSAWREEAQRRGFVLADVASFPSMLQGRSQARLVLVKAATDLYPLRGRVKVSVDPAQATASEGQPAQGMPAPGTVWIDPTLLDALRVRVGDTVQLGEKHLRIAKLIAFEPDRGPSFANIAPHVSLAMQDLAGTGLTGFGARVAYTLQVAARDPNDTRSIADFQQWLKERIAQEHVRGVRVVTLESARPEMRATLDRAGRFLSLVGLLSAMLAAVAVAMAARRFMLRHLDACAMLRCLGLTQNQATALYFIEFALVGLAGSLLGVALGFAAHYVLVVSLGSLVTTELPPISLLPALQGLAAGMILLLGFALPPVLQLRNVPHNRVIRREQAAPKPMALLTYGLGIAAFGSLMLWQAGDGQLAAVIAGGFLGGFALFALVAWAGLFALRRMRTWLPHQAWRFAVTSLQRRPGGTVVQVISLALGLMALLVLTVVRADLLRDWRAATPADAPNRFIINIQPDQKDAVAQRLTAAGVREVAIYPMIRGRLVAVNGRALDTAGFADEGARRLAEREFNLSTMQKMQASNQLVAGQWFSDAPGTAEASVEQGIARQLKWKLGDVLRFDMAGQIVEAKITSLRKVEWGSMRANFFVIINPRAMAGAPATWMTSFHLPAASASLANALTREFPNLTVIDVSAIIKQLQDVLDQVIAAVEFLFGFTLASGLLVLYAALMGTSDERQREGGLLRALGATRRQLQQAQWIEFSLVGGLAGLLAASGAAALGWALATYQFKFPWIFNPGVWMIGLAAGAVCALIGGWASLRNVLNQPPLRTLREA